MAAALHKNSGEGRAALVFKRIGIISVLIFLGYCACAVLIGGAFVMIVLEDGFFDTNHADVKYISDGIKKHLGLTILGFSTSYAFLWGVTLVICWIVEDIVMFVLACLNVFFFNGVLAYIELKGSIHVVFVVGLSVSHALIHHRLAHSELAKHYPTYRILTTVADFCVVFFLVFWVVGEQVWENYELQMTAFAFELVVWVLAALEYAYMVSLLHQNEYENFEDAARDTLNIPLLSRRGKTSMPRVNSILNTGALEESRVDRRADASLAYVP